MGQQYDRLNDRHIEFIKNQHLFFTATAAADSHINLSPKGLDSLRIESPQSLVWLNLTGSGNETAAHLLENRRITIMMCSFEGEPFILRIYGRGTSLERHSPEYDRWLNEFSTPAGARQIFRVSIDLVQTSCGFGVPLFSFKGQRDDLPAWAEKKGPVGISRYWADKNKTSIDGRPTGM